MQLKLGSYLVRNGLGANSDNLFCDSKCLDTLTFQFLTVSLMI